MEELSPGTSDPLCGRILGDFVVHERLDSGGFGVVYRAEQRTLARSAVVKVLHLRHRDDRRIVQRFSREAQVASRLDHPYAAHIYSFGAEPDGLLWIAMELVRGVSLETVLKTQGPIPLERFAPLFQRICEVVHAVHELGIIHRDIKPANVMVMSRGGQLLPKLLDFGVAKDLAVDDGGVVEASIERSATHTDASLEATVAGGSLTVEGAAVGTPPYMAPELWAHGSVGPRTDVYALGVLAFRVLRGRYPFDAKTEPEMRAAHLKRPAPALGEGFPAAVSEVIQRAMDKAYEQRFDTALALGQAFAVAARPEGEAPPMPTLEPPVRDTFLADAPQPLAEAVALLDAAKSERAVRAAVVEIARTAARYVALVALAARSKIGPGSTGDAAELAPLLQRLRNEGLVAQKWVELARVLVRPFARIAAAHPLPELVDLFFDETGHERDDPFRELLHADASDESSRAVPLIAATSVLLRRLSFVTSYPFAVLRGDRAERWTGLRRPRRASTMIRQKLAPDRALVLDEGGEVRLVLWPLIQVVAPTPRADPEVFLLDGPSRNGARFTAMPAGYQHHDDELWEWFSTVGLELGDESTRTAEVERAPYLGLASFGAQDAGVFFGRERESEIALNRLAVQPFLAVVGASGAGKSSFVAAGIVAALGDDASAIQVRPGPMPLRALEARLKREGVRAEGLATAVARDAEALRVALEVHAASLGRTVVLVVDQFEELFTLGADAAERRAYAEALCQAARDASRKVRVILTLRDDFLMRAQEIAALREAMSAGLQLLSTPSPEDLLRILSQPARRLGFSFEDERLPEEMVREVAGEPGALPLLSFTALRLWEQRDRQFKQITRRAYSALGGVGGALARHAEDLLDAMSPKERTIVREAFRHLVTAEGTRAALRRDELLDLLGHDAIAEGVLEKLIGARLAVAQDTEAGERIEIAHEALVQAWPRLVRWRQEDAEGARLRDQLRTAARQWSERNEPEGLLWRGDALVELQLWRTRHGQALTQAEAAFVRKSEHQALRARRLRRSLLTATFIVLSGVLVTVGILGQRAQRSANDARNRVLELYEEQARNLVMAEEPQRALAYLVEAWQSGHRSTGTQALIATALDALAPLERTFARHTGRLTGALLTADHQTLVTTGEDGFIQISDWRDGTLRRTIEGLGGPTFGADLDGDLVIAASEAGLIGIWRISDGQRVRTLDPHAGPTVSATVSHDHRLAAQVARDGAFLWSCREGTLVRKLPSQSDAYRMVAFSPDSRLLATVGDGGTTSLWSTTGAPLRTLVGAGKPLTNLAWSSDGGRLALSREDGTIAVHATASGRLEHELVGHTEAARALRFSGDGKLLLSGSPDRSARIWDAATGQLVRTLSGHRGAVVDARFSPDGARILTSSGDGKVRVWETSSGTLLLTLAGHLGASQIAEFDGNVALTIGADGTARRWALDRSPLQRILGGHGGTVRIIQFSADGRTLTTEVADQPLRFWDVERGVQRRVLDGRPGPMGATYASPALDAFAVGRSGGVLSIVDPASGAELRALSGHTSPIESVCFDPTGKMVYTGSQSHEVFAWDVRTGAIVWSAKAAADTAVWLAASLDGRWLASANSNGTAELRDARTGALVHTLRGHGGILAHVAFSDDSRRLVTSSIDKSAKIWNVATGALISSLDDHPDLVWGATFLADGARVATACLDGVVRLWDIESGRVVAAYLGHRAEVHAVTAEPGGARLVSGSADHSAIIWKIPPLFTGSVEELRRRIPTGSRYHLAHGQPVL